MLALELELEKNRGPFEPSAGIAATMEEAFKISVRDVVNLEFDYENALKQIRELQKESDRLKADRQPGTQSWLQNVSETESLRG